MLPGDVRSVLVQELKALPSSVSVSGCGMVTVCGGAVVVCSADSAGGAEVHAATKTPRAAAMVVMVRWILTTVVARPSPTMASPVRPGAALTPVETPLFRSRSS